MSEELTRPIIGIENRTSQEAFDIMADRIRGAQRYAAVVLAELSDAKKEISLLRDAIVTYGDRLRMGTVHDMAMQQAIDRAFDREN